MEVVCLILGPMLASQPCLPAFWVLTSLHLLSFLLKMFFIILVFIVFFSKRCEYFFCRLQKYYNYIIMKSCNQKCIKICSSMKVSLLYLGIDYHSLSLTPKSCTYVGLYGSGLFNFGSYVSFPTLFACFLGFDIPTSSFIFIENVFYYSCLIKYVLQSFDILFSQFLIYISAYSSFCKLSF